jgi:hypothetical protein
MASRSAWASSSCPTGRRTTTRTARETADPGTAPLTPRRRLEATTPRTQQAAEKTNEPVVGHRDAAQRWPLRRQLGSIAWEPIPAWRHAGLADFQTSFADPCARSTAAAGAAGHLPGLHQLGLTPRDREALAWSPTAAATARSPRRCSSASRPPAYTSPTSSPSSASPAGSIAHRLGLDCWSLRRRRHQARACHYQRQATRP